jgi:hypothetical protein
MLSRRGGALSRLRSGRGLPPTAIIGCLRTPTLISDPIKDFCPIGLWPPPERYRQSTPSPTVVDHANTIESCNLQILRLDPVDAAHEQKIGRLNHRRLDARTDLPGTRHGPWRGGHPHGWDVRRADACWPENRRRGERNARISELLGGDVQLQLHRPKQQRAVWNDHVEPRRSGASGVYVMKTTHVWTSAITCDWNNVCNEFSSLWIVDEAIARIAHLAVQIVGRNAPR